MKKIILGILCLFLVALVPSVMATVVWDGSEPLDISFDEDETPNPTEVLSAYVDTTSQTGTIVYSMDDSSLDTSKVSASLNPSTGLVTFTPVAEKNEDAGSIVFTVDDGDLTPDTFTATITINPMPDAPVWSGFIPDVTRNEDFGTYSHVTDLSTLVTDVDGDTLIFSILNEDTSEVDCQINGNQLILNSVDNWFGTGASSASCTVRVSDGTLTDEDSFLINVNSQNDAPIWSIPSIPDITTGLDEGFTSPYTHVTDLSTYITDVDGSSWIFSIINEDTSKVDCEISGNQLRLNSVPNWFGTVSCTIQADDGLISGTASDTFDITVGSINDARWKTGTGGLPSSIQIDEDKTQTLDLSNYVDKPVTIPSTSIIYGIDKTSLATSIVDVTLSGSVVTFTPVANQNGDAGSIVFTVDDSANSPTRSSNIVVRVTAENDIPVLQALSNYIVQEDILIGDIILPEAIDADGVFDITYYTLEVVSAPDESTFAKGYLHDDPTTAVVEKIVTTLWSGWNPTTITISGWTPDKEDIGELKLRLTAYDNQDSLTSPSRDSQEFTIDVYPKTMCELGDRGYVVDTITIEKPEDGDDFGPGDTINIEVTVENGANDDRDFMVEAILYDLDTQKKVIEVESDDENIDEDEDFTFRLEMKIPLDSDEDYKGDYVLYVKAYEDGKEDEHCLSDSIEIGIGRESHEVIIQSLTMNPLDVEAGDEVDVIVRVANIGRKDEEEVFVKLRNTELGIDIDSDVRDLGAYDESGNTYTFQFKGVKIPSDADTDNYDFEVFVVYDGGSTSTTWMDSPNYKIGSTTVNVGGTSTSADDTTGDVVSDTADGEGFPWSTVLWIIGDVVLIIVAIFFIKLIFSARKRRPKVKEVKL